MPIPSVVSAKKHGNVLCGISCTIVIHQLKICLAPCIYAPSFFASVGCTGKYIAPYTTSIKPFSFRSASARPAAPG
eukprot:8947275-Pyramimonas_sp.AAC.1